MYKLGIAPQIQDLLGKVAFTGNTGGIYTAFPTAKVKMHTFKQVKNKKKIISLDNE